MTILKRKIVLDDLIGMFASEIELLEQEPVCLQLLQAYADMAKDDSQQDSCSRQSNAEDQVAESSEEDTTSAWSQAHGHLIAYGLIDIELSGRDAGLSYRISTAGVRALKRLAVVAQQQSQEKLSA